MVVKEAAMPVELVLIKNLATGSEVRVSANPSSIRIEHTVPWERHKRSRGDNPTLEFDSQGPSILTCELTFRGVGTPPNVYKEFVEPLTAMTLVPRDAPAERRHPPQCLFVRGAPDNKYSASTVRDACRSTPLPDRWLSTHR